MGEIESCGKCAAGCFKGFLIGTILGFAVCVVLWIPGAVLISVADEKNLDDGKFLAGFICMMVAVGVAVINGLRTACVGGMMAVDDD